MCYVYMVRGSQKTCLTPSHNQIYQMHVNVYTTTLTEVLLNYECRTADPAGNGKRIAKFEFWC